jgi:hypothetical protein
LGDIAHPQSSLASAPGQALQKALEVSEPGDALEQEAEKVAEQVMRMAEPAAGSAGEDEGETSASAMLQRACATCEAQEKDDEETKLVHRDAIGAAPSVGATLKQA